RLLRGRGKFADDLKLRDMLYLCFVRSPYAHAKISSIDVSAVENMNGVDCVLTGSQIAPQTQPFIEIGPVPAAKIRDYPLALRKVRYQREPLERDVAQTYALVDYAAYPLRIEHRSRWSV